MKSQRLQWAGRSGPPMTNLLWLCLSRSVTAWSKNGAGENQQLLWVGTLGGRRLGLECLSRLELQRERKPIFCWKSMALVQLFVLFQLWSPWGSKASRQIKGILFSSMSWLQHPAKSFFKFTLDLSVLCVWVFACVCLVPSESGRVCLIFRNWS